MKSITTGRSRQLQKFPQQKPKDEIGKIPQGYDESQAEDVQIQTSESSQRKSRNQDKFSANEVNPSQLQRRIMSKQNSEKQMINIVLV
ncbi:hypothetical protein B9Z55_004443 [Caenorhabditis nigoni]|uniref:Uncharacterized protein n=1 Tax=Caenorhabditis nigoni TaxID=1611254 RepID=A0A2G5UWG3_9PELO|nr:hypothetical protein B9Z55_004443 [Caenorhabditis nigoni]